MPPESTGQVGSAGGVSLPLLGGTGRPRSRMGRWRAAVLVAVHVLIAAHIVQWLIMGSKVSPVEPSESMETLELGAINAGAIFFLVAILSTVVFGRFFCGWGCHVVALQDLCAWMMKKLGVRPKPFRSRLLVYAPLVLGLYMFVWPSFKRVALVPMLEAAELGLPVWIGAAQEFHGFETELIVEDFWATFPPWYVAIPFLGVCGFACVYFLGSKGFCTYGCPYGGFFGVVDRVSPGRIVVSDSCGASGHCSAVCTSNVRVAEEVRDFGAVVDPGCMKCLDCVSACPNDALRFAMSTPAILTKPRDASAAERRGRIAQNPKRYDLGLAEEIVVGCVGLLLFFAFRGMLNLVPMLMAVGMAGIGAFLVWKTWRLALKPNVRLQSLQLRSRGRFRPAGVVVALGTVLLCLAAVWSGLVLSERWRAGVTHDSVEVPLAVALRPEFDLGADAAPRIDRAIRRFERSDAWSSGGLGWTLRPQDRRELAFLYLLAGAEDRALAQLDRLVLEGRPTDDLIVQVLELRRRQGEQGASMETWLAGVLADHPMLHAARAEWSVLALRGGAPIDEVMSTWQEVIDEDGGIDAVLAAGGVLTEIGRPAEALAIVEAELAEATQSADQLIRAARFFASVGDSERSRALLDRASGMGAITPGGWRTMGDLWAASGALDRARTALDTGIEQHPGSPVLHEASGLLDLYMGRIEAAEQSYRRALEAAGPNPYAEAGVGESIVRAGLGSRQEPIYQLGIDGMRSAAESSGSGVLMHDLGQALAAGGLLEEAVEAFERAAAWSPDNPSIRSALDAARGRRGPR